MGGRAGCRARADGGAAAPHDAGGAAVGGPSGGDCPAAAGERTAAHGARHFKKLSRAVARLRAVKTACAILAAWRVAAVSLVEAQPPLKSVVHGWMRN